MANRAGNAPYNTAAVTPAGTSRTDATQILTKSPALIAATGDGSAGIKLPAASEGKVFAIKNRAAAATLSVYPYDSGDQINAITAGSPITMAAATSATFISLDSTHWYTVPLLPS